MAVRNGDDPTSHEAKCHALHHEHEKRLLILETESKLNKSTVDGLISELFKRQADSEILIQHVAETLATIKLQLEVFIAKTTNSSGAIKYFLQFGLPLIFSIVTATWWLNEKLHHSQQLQNQKFEQNFHHQQQPNSKQIT